MRSFMLVLIPIALIVLGWAIFKFIVHAALAAITFLVVLAVGGALFAMIMRRREP